MAALKSLILTGDKLMVDALYDLYLQTRLAIPVCVVTAQRDIEPNDDVRTMNMQRVNRASSGTSFASTTCSRE